MLFGTKNIQKRTFKIKLYMC